MCSSLTPRIQLGLFQHSLGSCLLNNYPYLFTACNEVVERKLLMEHSFRFVCAEVTQPSAFPHHYLYCNKSIFYAQVVQPEFASVWLNPTRKIAAITLWEVIWALERKTQESKEVSLPLTAGHPLCQKSASNIWRGAGVEPAVKGCPWACWDSGKIPNLSSLGNITLSSETNRQVLTVALANNGYLLFFMLMKVG